MTDTELIVETYRNLAQKCRTLRGIEGEATWDQVLSWCWECCGVIVRDGQLEPFDVSPEPGETWARQPCGSWLFAFPPRQAAESLKPHYEIGRKALAAAHACVRVDMETNGGMTEWAAYRAFGVAFVLGHATGAETPQRRLEEPLAC